MLLQALEASRAKCTISKSKAMRVSCPRLLLMEDKGPLHSAGMRAQGQTRCIWLHEASGDFLRPTVLLVLLRNMTAVNWQMVV